MKDDRITTPVKRAYRIYFLLLLLALNTLSYADRHLFSILLPSLKAEFGVSDALLGMIAGPGFILSYVAFSMPLARLADGWTRRGVLALSATLWSAATALCGLASGIVQLATARLLVGVGEAGGLPPAQSLLSDLYDERRRAGALGILASGTYFGLVLGLFGGAAIASAYGWRAAFLALALPGIPLALLTWWTGPKREHAVAAAPGPGEGFWASVRHCWSVPTLRLIAIGVGIFNIFGYAGAIWMPAYLMRSHEMSLVEAGAWLGLGAAAGGIVGSFASGALVDRLRVLDERWQLRLPAFGFLFVIPLFAAMFTIPGGAVLHLGFLEIPVVGLLSLATSLLSALWAGPSFAAVARLVPPARRAQAMALLVVVINVIGSAMGPLATGIVSDLLAPRLQGEALRYSLLLMSVLTIVGATVFWRASNRYPVDLRAAL